MAQARHGKVAAPRQDLLHARSAPHPSRSAHALARHPAAPCPRPRSRSGHGLSGPSLHADRPSRHLDRRADRAVSTGRFNREGLDRNGDARRHARYGARCSSARRSRRCLSGRLLGRSGLAGSVASRSLPARLLAQRSLHEHVAAGRGGPARRAGSKEGGAPSRRSSAAIPRALTKRASAAPPSRALPRTSPTASSRRPSGSALGGLPGARSTRP